MSNPGTPLDNAVIESFFGHLKYEIDYKNCKTFNQLSEMIDNYMFYYNMSEEKFTSRILIISYNYLSVQHNIRLPFLLMHIKSLCPYHCIIHHGSIY